MSEIERSILKTPSITKQAKTFNSIDINNLAQGLKIAVYMEKQTREAELEQKRAKENVKVEETLVPTREDIEKELKNGEYRQMIGPERGQQVAKNVDEIQEEYER